MKKISKILAISLTLTFAISSILGVSAAKYVAKPVAEDFATLATDFLQPGDINADGKVDTTDYTELRSLILNDRTAQYSDVNGDEISNICDLVLQDINTNINFVADGAMNLNGKSVYNAEITSVLNTGAEYKVAYTTTGDVTVKLVGLTGAEVTASGDTFKAPLNFSDTYVQLYVVGNGTVEDLSVTRINMDNDYSISAN